MSIRYREPESAFIYEMPTPPLPVAPHVFQVLPSDHKLSQIQAPTLIPAAWLETVQQRIRNSITISAEDYVNDGSSLQSAIAARAIRFFQGTSDVLPGEPYIYSSLDGDLVAEFRAECGSMTAIVGKQFAVTYAVVNGTVLDQTIELRDDNLASARQNLQQLTNNLRKGDHGAVESAG